MIIIMILLLLLLLLSNIIYCIKYDENLFLIGDSVDRISVLNWCKYEDGNGYSFGESTLKHDSFNTSNYFFLYL